jgi:hypothetical protein
MRSLELLDLGDDVVVPVLAFERWIDGGIRWSALSETGSLASRPRAACPRTRSRDVARVPHSPFAACASAFREVAR